MTEQEYIERAERDGLTHGNAWPHAGCRCGYEEGWWAAYFNMWGEGTRGWKRDHLAAVEAFAEQAGT